MEDKILSTPNTHLGAIRIREIMSASKEKEIFFLGAGGIMMSSLALLTKRAGYATRGSDRSRTALTEKLEAAEIEMFYGHSESNLGDNCGAVVYTVAVSPDNPEYARAQREGIPCISRADYLGYIMTGYKNRVGIAGMHGKSTCTSMCAEIFLSAAKDACIADPTVISGAEYASMSGAYHLGEHDNFIFEACEYMDSFLDFNPNVAVLLNAEMEHVDYFKSIEQIRDSFKKYASLVGADGTVIYNADDKNIVMSVSDINTNKISFALEAEADVTAINIKCCTYPMEFDVVMRGETVAHVTLPSFGRHNVYNALAAFTAAYSCGINADEIAQGLRNFKGAKRRMEYKGSLLGASVYDDYGHHPTEIGATLEGAKTACTQRLVCVFQPHTYSRTSALADKFVEAFDCADKVILTDIYAARETNESGITSARVAEMIGEKAIYGGDIESTAATLKKTVREGDLVIVMGAGDIFKIYGMLDLK
jgi:UDP-N-acetylmuramate--alanine ligase